MALTGTEIVVVGAGIGGLAAALALAQRGARVTVLERAPELREVGAGLQVGPNGVAVLEALGLRDAAEDHASLPEAILLRDYRDGRTVARVPLGRECVARYGRPYWQFHRADLLALLANGARQAGVTLRLGAPVTGVETTGALVRVAIEGGPALEAAAAIGADGVRSALRGAHFGGAAPRFTGHVAWRGLVPAERVPPGLLPDAACVTMGPGRHVVSYPLRRGSLWNVVAVEERAAWAAEGWTHPDDPAALRAAFAGWEPAVTGLLEGMEETFLWGLFDHPELPEWTRGRIALLGDACHPMLPFLAQGATMALEDAWVLATELAAAAPDLERGLSVYEDRRKDRATRVQRAAARNARVYHMAAPGPRAALHLGLGTASRLAPGLLLGRFDWLFGANVTGPFASD
jgi:salicylate hydroxylase